MHLDAKAPLRTVLLHSAKLSWKMVSRHTLHSSCLRRNFKVMWPAPWGPVTKCTEHSKQMAAASLSYLIIQVQFRAQKGWTSLKCKWNELYLCSLQAACNVISVKGCVKKMSGKAYVCRVESTGMLGTFSPWAGCILSKSLLWLV